MPNYRGKIAKILWGAGNANTLAMGYPLDSVVSYPAPRAGGDTEQYRSGVEDAWDAGDDELLDGDLRYIPVEDGVTPEGRAATGWNGAAGVAAFLTWARKKNPFLFYPDAVNAPTLFYSCYLVAPMAGKPDLEANFTRKVTLSMRTTDGTAFDGY